MFKKLYIEISNICNLSCSFCHGTRRAPKMMTADEFLQIAKKVQGFSQNYCLHVLGEPLIHPQLSEILDICEKYSMPVNITTNGTLLKDNSAMLLSKPALKKVSISLHSFEGCGGSDIQNYLCDCVDFAKKCIASEKICVLRLWNLDGAFSKGENTLNDDIIAMLKADFKDEWKKCFNGYKLKEYLFLEWGEKFEWPDMSAPDYGERGFCYGLRSQIAILCDGTVVPCCLDSDGNIPLGNIYESELTDILSSPRAEAINRGFTARKITEPLCRRCGYANRFKK